MLNSSHSYINILILTFVDTVYIVYILTVFFSNKENRFKCKIYMI